MWFIFHVRAKESSTENGIPYVWKRGRLLRKELLESWEDGIAQQPGRAT
jgi:hypothetical protein